MSTVFERFELIAKSSPAVIAFRGINDSHTYEELHCQALRVLSCLNQLDLPQPGLIALFFKDRFKPVVAMLGVSGTKHAYIPLDTSDPDDRLNFIIKDSKPVVVLTESGLINKATQLFSETCLVLNYDDLAESVDEVLLSHSPTPDSLLYVLYTSGSTGQPKGVCQSHKNLLFYIDTYIESIGIQTGNHISWLYNYVVSASNMDIYGAFLSGATLCSFDVQKYGPRELANWLKHTKITLLHTVPTVLRELLRTIQSDEFFSDLDVVDLAGEALYGEDVVRFMPHISPDCRFFNRLAATEICFIAHYQVDFSTVTNINQLPVGRCPEGVEVGIVDSVGRLVPVGEVGFIVVGSQYICSGYLNRTELDAETFSGIENQPGWRRYKSSDLGMVDAEGNLHFIGREGSRIKLRGYSIDLSEVEAALLCCADVTEAVVIPRSPDGKEVQELLAWVSIMPGKTAHPNVIRRQLSRIVPNFMLPSGYIFSDNFPRTSSGKVNRQALASLDLQKFKYRPDYAEPLDDIEQRISEIFTIVLKFEPIGRLDDFFLLGGDSLGLVDLQLMLCNEFGYEASNIHENATVSGIAVQFRQKKSDIIQTMPVILPVQTGGTYPPMFLVHGRRGQAHVSPHFLSLVGADQPLYVIQARGLDGLTSPHLTIADMATDYVESIRELQTIGPYFIGALCAGGYIAIEMARQLRQQGEKVLPLLLIDPPPFYFIKGASPLLEEKFVAAMKRRIDSGDWEFNIDSSQHIQAAINVARSFEDALVSQGAPTFYDGPVIMISSEARLPFDGWICKARLLLIVNFVSRVFRLNKKRKYLRRWSKRKLHNIFGNNITIFPVEGKHSRLLDKDNDGFKRQFAKCLAAVRQDVEID